MTSPVLGNILYKHPIPEYLYHGSAYKQEELKPGYMYTKKAVVWDKYESNIYLYATSDKESAKLLGISSAWEKIYDLTKTSFDGTAKVIHLEFEKNKPTKEQLLQIDVYLYTIPYVPGVWIKNNNPFNNIDSEYKTKQTITNISSREHLNVPEVLKDFTIFIK